MILDRGFRRVRLSKTMAHQQPEIVLFAVAREQKIKSKEVHVFMVLSDEHTTNQIWWIMFIIQTV